MIMHSDRVGANQERIPVGNLKLTASKLNERETDIRLHFEGTEGDFSLHIFAIDVTHKEDASTEEKAKQAALKDILKKFPAFVPTLQNISFVVKDYDPQSALELLGDPETKFSLTKETSLSPYRIGKIGLRSYSEQNKHDGVFITIEIRDPDLKQNERKEHVRYLDPRL